MKSFGAEISQELLRTVGLNHSGPKSNYLVIYLRRVTAIEGGIVIKIAAE